MEDHSFTEVASSSTRENDTLDLCFVSHSSFALRHKVIAGISHRDTVKVIVNIFARVINTEVGISKCMLSVKMSQAVVGDEQGHAL